MISHQWPKALIDAATVITTILSCKLSTSGQGFVTVENRLAQPNSQKIGHNYVGSCLSYRI